MGHTADEQEPASEMDDLTGLDDQDDLDHLADLDHFDETDRLDEIDRLDHLDDLDDSADPDDFEDPDGWTELEGPDLYPPEDEQADERLRQMLETLEAAIPKDIPTVWIRVFRAPGDEGAEKSPPADGDEPERIEVDRDLPSLIGYVAPLDCIAVAIVGVGRAHHFEPTQNARPNRRTRRAGRRTDQFARRPIDLPPSGMAVRAICLMDRSGRMAGHTRLEDGRVIPTPPESGRLVDALRRCFGLRTAPAEFPPSELISRLWLASVLARSEDTADRLGWKQVRELHPSAEALRAIGVPLTGPTLDRAREVSATSWTWSRLRMQAIEGGWLPRLIEPELASWMDEGMFSRWVLEGTRTTTELLELATPWVAPSVLAKLARAVRA